MGTAKIREDAPDGPPQRRQEAGGGQGLAHGVVLGRRQAARGVGGDVQLLQQDALGHGPSFLPP